MASITHQYHIRSEIRLATKRGSIPSLAHPNKSVLNGALVIEHENRYREISPLLSSHYCLPSCSKSLRHYLSHQFLNQMHLNQASLIPNIAVATLRPGTSAVPARFFAGLRLRKSSCLKVTVVLRASDGSVDTSDCRRSECTGPPNTRSIAKVGCQVR